MSTMSLTHVQNFIHIRYVFQTL